MPPLRFDNAREDVDRGQQPDRCGRRPKLDITDEFSEAREEPTTTSTSTYTDPFHVRNVVNVVMFLDSKVLVCDSFILDRCSASKCGNCRLPYWGCHMYRSLDQMDSASLYAFIIPTTTMGTRGLRKQKIGTNQHGRNSGHGYSVHRDSHKSAATVQLYSLTSLSDVGSSHQSTGEFMSDSKTFQLMFGMQPATFSRTMHRAERSLFRALLDIPVAAVSWPSHEQQREWARLVQQREPLVENVWVIDGKNYDVQDLTLADKQNVYYNGWLHSVKVAGTFCFGADDSCLGLAQLSRLLK
ncbi:hypothetical protein BJ742DRAFT_738943 [Cladochytrium replicatum]|nr:hypothetical protein BJ742DRAFT_738943 [Cladochytrium replicatum]